MEKIAKRALPSDGSVPQADSIVQQSRFEDTAEAVTAYLGQWWAAHGKLIQGLIGDLILYVCLFGYLALISGLINMFGLGSEYHELRQYGILIADGAILLMFIRKLAITLWNL
jgi:hypothetical protein